jgi:hypothetical protein
VVRRLLAVAALLAAAAAVALVVTGSKTHSCDDVDYAGFRAAPLSQRRSELGWTLYRCHALRGLSRPRVEALIGRPDGRDFWEIGPVRGSDGQLLTVDYDRRGRVQKVDIVHG